MPEEIHRDIFSGMVAEELNKAGYFGAERELYGFLCVQDEKQSVVTAETELACAEKSFLAFWAGAQVSTYTMEKQRVYEDDSAEEVTQKMTARLCENLLEQKNWIELQQLIAKGSISESTFQNTENALSSAKPIYPSNAVKRLYGFAYQRDGHTGLYSNAYFPTVWNKWFTSALKGEKLSAIVYKDYASGKSAYQLQEDFKLYLRNVVEKDF